MLKFLKNKRVKGKENHSSGESKKTVFIDRKSTSMSVDRMKDRNMIKLYCMFAINWTNAMQRQIIEGMTNYGSPSYTLSIFLCSAQLIILIMSKKQTSNKYPSIYSAKKTSSSMPLCSINPPMTWHLPVPFHTLSSIITVSIHPAITNIASHQPSYHQSNRYW